MNPRNTFNDIIFITAQLSFLHLYESKHSDNKALSPLRHCEERSLRWPRSIPLGRQSTSSRIIDNFLVDCHTPFGGSQ
jgi:hypothetical protein